MDILNFPKTPETQYNDFYLLFKKILNVDLHDNNVQENLHDGILLCNLINIIQPGMISKINKKRSPFFMLENIQLFLQASRNLGLKDTELFSPSDLYDDRNIDKVAFTLKKLLDKLVPPKNPEFNDKKTTKDIESHTVRLDNDIQDFSNFQEYLLKKKTSKNNPKVWSDTTSSSGDQTIGLSLESNITMSNFQSLLSRNSTYLLQTSKRLNSGNHQSDIKIDSQDKASRISVQKIFDLTTENDKSSLKTKNVNETYYNLDSTKVLRTRTFINSKTFREPNTNSEKLLSNQNSLNSKKGTLEKTLKNTCTKSSNTELFNYSDQKHNENQSTDLLQTSYFAYNQTETKISNLNDSKSTIPMETTETDTHQFNTTNAISDKPPKKIIESHLIKEDQKCVYDETSKRLTVNQNGSRKTVQYQIGNCVGKGQFGSVYRALNLENGQMVAIKKIPFNKHNSDKLDEIMHEVNLLKSLSNPRIVCYHDFVLTDDNLFLIMEYVENGSLAATLKSFGVFPEKLVLAYILKILEGLIYLHSSNVVHCDLKAANILTTKQGNTKLADFGVSLNLGLHVSYDESFIVAGTPCWMSPEIIKLEGPTTASDIWSLGCTIIELLTGKPPYADMVSMAALYHIVEDEHPPLPENLSENLKSFLLACFEKEPKKRPTAIQLMEHPCQQISKEIKRNRNADSKENINLLFLRATNEMRDPKEAINMKHKTRSTSNPKNNGSKNNSKPKKRLSINNYHNNNFTHPLSSSESTSSSVYSQPEKKLEHTEAPVVSGPNLQPHNFRIIMAHKQDKMCANCKTVLDSFCVGCIVCKSAFHEQCRNKSTLCSPIVPSRVMIPPARKSSKRFRQKASKIFLKIGKNDNLDLNTIGEKYESQQSSERNSHNNISQNENTKNVLESSSISRDTSIENINSEYDNSFKHSIQNKMKSNSNSESSNTDISLVENKLVELKIKHDSSSDISQTTMKYEENSLSDKNKVYSTLTTSGKYSETSLSSTEANGRGSVITLSDTKPICNVNNSSVLGLSFRPKPLPKTPIKKSSSHSNISHSNIPNNINYKDVKPLSNGIPIKNKPDEKNLLGSKTKNRTTSTPINPPRLRSRPISAINYGFHFRQATNKGQNQISKPLNDKETLHSGTNHNKNRNSFVVLGGKSMKPITTNYLVRKNPSVNQIHQKSNRSFSLSTDLYRTITPSELKVDVLHSDIVFDSEIIFSPDSIIPASFEKHMNKLDSNSRAARKIKSNPMLVKSKGSNCSLM
ncbi:hypothetical protein BB559_001214 [Furculomyces boomerangus]|uniref:Protein kinase domain-containing protein n=1 Tax=Furculomyces boomerangus TaxID=61424 RepID=A0A2T9Z2U9_9FUNG|nr:hypothetical protein BB559_001214 [Furculomyces boomerangus]